MAQLKTVQGILRRLLDFTLKIQHFSNHIKNTSYRRYSDQARSHSPITAKKARGKNQWAQLLSFLQAIRRSVDDTGHSDLPR
jgi:hypothetical protein